MNVTLIKENAVSTPTTVTVDYQIPLEEIQFQLSTFGYEEVSSFECYEDYDLETALGIISEAGELLMEHWLPVNNLGDVVGVHYNQADKSVQMPDGFIDAYNAFAESGYMGLGYPAEFGGGGAPHMLSNMLGEISYVNTEFDAPFCPAFY